MHIDKFLPIKYESWVEAIDSGDGTYRNCVFLENFGPISKGEKFKSIFFSATDGMIEVFQDVDCNKWVATIEFKAIPTKYTAKNRFRSIDNDD